MLKDEDGRLKQTFYDQGEKLGKQADKETGMTEPSI